MLYYRRFPLLCIKRDAPCQLQINCHFHFLNFPTASSLLHIRKILVHWPLLEISGPKKWVVGATLALKQKFLAGTLLKQLTINNLWTPISTRIFIFESLRGLIIGILCYYCINNDVYFFIILDRTVPFNLPVLAKIPSSDACKAKGHLRWHYYCRRWSP